MLIIAWVVDSYIFKTVSNDSAKNIVLFTDLFKIDRTTGSLRQVFVGRTSQQHTVQSVCLYNNPVLLAEPLTHAHASPLMPPDKPKRQCIFARMVLRNERYNMSACLFISLLNHRGKASLRGGEEGAWI